MHLQFPSFPPWLQSLFTVCQGERQAAIFLSSFSLLLLFLVIPVSCVNNTFFGWFSYCVLPFCIKSHHIFVFNATVSCWDSWKYVLDPTIKDDIFKDISAQSGPSFARRKDIFFENLSIGNNYDQSIALSQTRLSENTL